MRILIVLLILGHFLDAPAWAQSGFSGSPDVGAILFEQCRGCHSDTEDVHMAGPSLFNLIGREMGSAEGFEYSTALAQDDHVWDTGLLTAWLVQPQILVSETEMHFEGLHTRQDIENLIAYITTLKN